MGSTWIASLIYFTGNHLNGNHFNGNWKTRNGCFNGNTPDLPFCFRYASVMQAKLQVLNAGRLTHIGVGAQNGPRGSKRFNATRLLPFCFRYAKTQGTPISLGITRDNASHLTRIGVASVLLPFCFRFASVMQTKRHATR